MSSGLQAGLLYEGEVSRNSTWLMIKQTEDFCFLLTSSPFRQIILDLELEQISCHIQVQSNVGMVDAGDLEPCTEYLVMIRWTLFFCGPLGDIVADNDIDADEIEQNTSS